MPEINKLNSDKQKLKYVPSHFKSKTNSVVELHTLKTPSTNSDSATVTFQKTHSIC